MCSLTESALDPAMVAEKVELVGQDLTCKKCRLQKSVVNLRVRDTYCRDCFLTAVHHRVRATLGKHKATRPGDRVLVAATGGHNSSALLHVLQQGVQTDTKRLLFLPSVLYVDEGAVYGQEEAVRRARVEEVVAALRQYGFPVHMAQLESYNSESVAPVLGGEELVFSPELSSSLAASFASVREGSARQELLLQLRRSVLVRAARELGAAKVFTGENGTALAVELLAGVAGGAGASLPHRVGWRDSREEGVEVLRPLRDVSAKESALYCALHRLDTVAPCQSWGVGQDALYSIRKLTEEFLVGLQQDFPATIPTIFKTGDKLCAGEGEGEGCVLCGGSLDTDTALHCSLQATQFSSLVSGRGREEGLGERVATLLEEEGGRVATLLEEEARNCTTSTSTTSSCATSCAEPSSGVESSGCCGAGDGSCKSGQAPASASLQEVVRQLCYSCRRTLAKVRQVQELPAGLLRRVDIRLRREEMRSEISEFLL